MKKRLQIGQIILTVLFVLICAGVFIPFWYLVSASFSNENDIMYHGFKLIPEHFDLTAYKFVFTHGADIGQAYMTTILFSVLGTVFSVLVIMLAAYPLSNPKMRGRNKIAFYFYFTVLFSGGLVPSYILITRYLNLDDTIWVYIIPSAFSPMYAFMMRSFFQDIPQALSESMRLDGAGEYTILFKLIIPLSKPIIATIALFQFLGKWNDWNTSMLYINDQRLISLQYLLQKMLRDVKFIEESAMNSSLNVSSEPIPTLTVQMATAMVVAGPALVIFPFFQKYFVKGLRVGSVKG